MTIAPELAALALACETALERLALNDCEGEEQPFIAELRGALAKAGLDRCGHCEEPHGEETATWQQWQCACCGRWNDKAA